MDYHYPTQADLDTITHWPIEKASIVTLFDYVYALWNRGCGVYRELDEPPPGVVPFLLKNPRYIALMTGGWSGNEAIVEALRDNGVLWALSWVASSRGGMHIFEVGMMHDSSEERSDD